MVKVSQLTDEQLVGQIEKYEKIVKGLHREREKRVAADVPAQNLMTEREKSLVDQDKTNTTGMTNTFTVEISEADLKGAAEVENAPADEREDQEDLMRVTRLLQLSKSDLEELSKDKHRQQADKKAEVIKNRRKVKKS